MLKASVSRKEEEASLALEALDRLKNSRMRKVLSCLEGNWQA
jgi:hypothetical protein